MDYGYTEKEVTDMADRVVELEKEVIKLYYLKGDLLDRDAAITGYRQYNQEAHNLLRQVLSCDDLDLYTRNKILEMTGGS
jgi:hypothetical protein